MATKSPKGLSREELHPRTDDTHVTGEVDAAHRQRIEALFRAHNEALIRLLRTRLRSAQEAREVAQEAYVRLLGLHDPSAVSFLERLLFKTAINLATDRLRQQAVHGRLNPLVFFEAEEERTSPPPDRHYLAQQEVALLRNALKELPPLCRKVFLMHKLQGLSVEDIAARLNLNVRTTYRYVARALEYCGTRLLEGKSSPPRSSSR